jgi:gliding motility-associated-like protein
MADFTASDTTPAPGDQITFTNLSLNALTNYWTFGDNTGTSSLENPGYSYTAPGTYPVWLFITGDSGCEDSTTVNITIGFSGYAIPSAFSPNSDGLNDVFFIRGGPFTEYELRVFNDWGQQVFLSTEQQIGWDGTFKGKDLQEGVYVLIFRGKMADGTELDITGDISLIR